MIFTPFSGRLRLAATLLFLSFFAAILSPCANADAITIDASVAPVAPTALNFATGGKSPSGHELAVNNRYFTLDGKPFFPVMGEFHYSRYPASEWEDEILKMKAGGINVISLYIFWIHHEEVEGQFDWAGQKDLRKFVELCAKHGMLVWARIGPWDHGEVRNGGFPDWLVAKVRVRRSNDPTYLDYVAKFYDQIGQQLKGLFWKDGGAIIGVQVENEYHPGRGGIEHMNQLLHMAHASGIDAPFYTETSWDNAAVPSTGFLPVFGGYTEQFWSNSLTELPPNQNFFFDDIRAEDNVMGDLQPKNSGYNTKYTDFPFLTAEMGGGMAIAYHRRPIMYADDSTAAALVKLGSGITGLGYYMYHGGTNPDGLTSLQETQSQPDGAGYNDMEAKSYDFQAPLGEFGQFHPSFFTMKSLNMFVDEFGSLLAPMAAYFPTQIPPSTNDTATPRVAVRSDGKSAFIFINNYERNYPLDEHKDFQVSLQLPSGTLQIPHSPTTIPSGTYTIWPVNLAIGGVNLRYATAQLLAKLSEPKLDTYVFMAGPGVKPEFAFEHALGDSVIGLHGQTVTQKNDVATVSGFEPGTDATIRITHAGQTTQVIVLTHEQGLNLYKANVAGRDRLFLSQAGLFFDEHQVHLTSRNPADLKVGVYPAFADPSLNFTDEGKDGVFHEYAARVNDFPSNILLATDAPIKPAAPSAPARVNPSPRRHIVMEPSDADFDRAAIWLVKIPPSVLTETSARPVLQIDYEGDVARLYAGDRFLDDNFYKGTTFEYGLWRLTPQELQQGLDLKILPLRQDTALFLEKSARPDFTGNQDVLKIKSIGIAWDYRAVLSDASKPNLAKFKIK